MWDWIFTELFRDHLDIFFPDYGINSILYQRGIYPDEKFIRKEQYGLKVLVTDDDSVNEYLKHVLDQIRGE